MINNDSIPNPTLGKLTSVSERTYRDVVLEHACTYTTPFSPRNIEHDLRELYQSTGMVDWTKHTASRTGLVLHGEACKLNGCVRRVEHGVYEYVPGTVPSKAPRRTYEHKSVREPKPTRSIHVQLDQQFARLLSMGVKPATVESVQCNQCQVRVRVRELGEHKRVWHPLNMGDSKSRRTVQRERKYTVDGK